MSAHWTKSPNIQKASIIGSIIGCDGKVVDQRRILGSQLTPFTPANALKIIGELQIAPLTRCPKHSDLSDIKGPFVLQKRD